MCVCLRARVCVWNIYGRPTRNREKTNKASPAGLLYTTGLYYVQMLSEYGKSRSYTAWMGSLTNAFFMLGGKFLHVPATYCSVATAANFREPEHQ